MLTRTDIEKAARWHRTLEHEHEKEPFVAWATLHILDDYDMTRFRKMLARKAILPFVAFIEQTKRGRPHFHLLFKQLPDKAEFRQYIKNCLQGERFRLQVKPLNDPKGIFFYVTKLTQIYRGKGRSVFTVGQLWTEKTAELRKIKPSEVQRKTLHMAESNPTFVMDIALGLITTDQLRKPQFRSYWKRQLWPSEARHLDYEKHLQKCWCDANIYLVAGL